MDDLLHKQHRELEEKHWWFKVRRRIIFDLTKKSMGQPSKQKILDFGCNHGHLVHELSNCGYNAFGVDVSMEAINYGRGLGVNNIEYYNPAVYRKDKDVFPQHQFDVIFALDVIEHIKDDVGALSLLKEKLTSSGKIIITVPAYMWLWGLQDRIAYHERRYTRKTLTASIKAAGLSLSRISYFNTILFFPIVTVRMFQKIFPPKIISDFDINSPILNKVFYFIFGIERYLLRTMDMPFGISILVIARKKP